MAHSIALGGSRCLSASVSPPLIPGKGWPFTIKVHLCPSWLRRTLPKAREGSALV